MRDLRNPASAPPESCFRKHGRTAARKAVLRGSFLEGNDYAFEIPFTGAFRLKIALAFERDVNDPPVMGVHRGKCDGFAPAPDLLGCVDCLLAEIAVIFPLVVIPEGAASLPVSVAPSARRSARFPTGSAL